MKNWKKSILSLSLLGTTLLGGLAPATVFAQEELPAQVQAIKDAGVFKVGIKEDVPHFGFLNPDTTEHEGFEIDLARLIAEEITGSADNIAFTGVTPKTRGPLLDNGEVDAVIATFTITEERKETYNFTEPYFIDEVGFLVRTEDGITDFAGLEGKTIGVPQSATTKDLVQAEADDQGVTVKFSELATYPELKTALTSKRIDAMSVDKSILAGYVDDNSQILDIGFSPQEYGIATKLSNDELHNYLNELIAGWLEDGTIAELLEANGVQATSSDSE
ncbi:transporter substrate-binding domain-containing protein [Aerococcaceae bacterium DSM 111021]|nr:transporter substrate-binding domain-containing protein [Aerococcaceae bacterium DSM 111021]